WHRDSDFYQRDYLFKHGPPPQYATPPSELSSPRGFPAGMQPLPGRGRALVAGWHLLLLDAYDLLPVRDGGDPKRIWTAEIRLPDDGLSLDAALARMVRVIFAENPEGPGGGNAKTP
ncbi:MAG: hypothetical protein LBV01_00395, partial [Deltaproteobacteria bacterium]|nr:hypothetical protein [Deltaproteobacteria bacterium]